MPNEFKAKNGVIAPALILPGSTSGQITIQSPSAPGTQTLTLPATAGSNNNILGTNGSGTLSWITVATALGYTPYNGATNPNGYTTNTGTVTSVGLSLPGIFTVTGSPVTGTGTLTASLASQTANTVWAAPNGSAGAPTFRSLVAADIPALTLENIPDSWVKRSVKVATTANITLSGTQTIDGVAVAAGDRVLVKNQTSAAENGIYVASATAWSRAADANISSELAAATVGVDQGTTNGGLSFDTDFKSADTLGTTAMTWHRVLDAATIGSTVQAWDGDLDAIAAISATSGLLRKTAANTWSLDTNTYITTDGTARVAVKDNGTTVGSRRGINFIPGTNVTLSVADDAANEEVDVTINSSGGGITLSDDTTTNATRYILFDDSTSGAQTALTVSSTKLTFNPSTGIVTATGFSGPINGTVGATTASSGAFTTLSASSTVSGTGFSTYLASPPAIGGTTAAAGSFTTLTANTTATTSALSVTYAPTTTSGAAIVISGKDSQGGVGYFDFLRATNTTSGATNPTKTFRLTPDGSIEIVNSAYTAIIASLSNAGALTIPSSLTINNASDLRLGDSDSSNFVGFKSPATVSANVIWTLPATDGTNGQVLTTNGSSVLSWAPSYIISNLTYVIDNGDSVINTGIKGDLVVPFACTINSWTILGDTSGSIVVDIWKNTYANYPPTVANTITASAKPTVSSANKNQSSTLTGWTTAVAANDILRFNVDSATTVKRITLVLSVTRT